MCVGKGADTRRDQKHTTVLHGSACGFNLADHLLSLQIDFMLAALPHPRQRTTNFLRQFCLRSQINLFFQLLPCIFPSSKNITCQERAHAELSQDINAKSSKADRQGGPLRMTLCIASYLLRPTFPTTSEKKRTTIRLAMCSMSHTKQHCLRPHIDMNVPGFPAK